MRIDPKELIGEATEYDKKRSVERKKVKDWLKSVSAFANSFYSGGLVNLLQDSMSFVSRNTKKAWRKTGNGRIEMPDYPDNGCP